MYQYPIQMAKVQFINHDERFTFLVIHINLTLYFKVCFNCNKTIDYIFFVFMECMSDQWGQKLYALMKKSICYSHMYWDKYLGNPRSLKI